MKRFVALLALALLAMAGTAVAKTHGAKHGGKHGAKVYRATLAPIDLGATAPSGDSAQADDPTTDPTGDTTPTVSGRKRLREGQVTHVQLRPREQVLRGHP